MLRIVFLGKQKYRIIKILIHVLIFITSVGIRAQQLQLAPATKQPLAAFGFSISHTDECLVAGTKDDTTWISIGGPFYTTVSGRTGAAFITPAPE